jgi:hypothetical protein
MERLAQVYSLLFCACFAACAEGASEPRTSCERSSDCAAGWKCEAHRCEAPDAGREDAAARDSGARDAGAADSGSDAGAVCEKLASPGHGSVTQPARAASGDEATYKCDDGYHLSGAAKRSCDASGDWSGAAPTCEQNACPALDAPEHGHVMLDKGQSVGSKATYSCDSTFQLNGNATRTCQNDGSWSGDAPQCTCSSDLDTDAMNCGTCGTRCSSGTCADGACVRRVFVTGTTQPAIFGSLTQADAACHTLALGAGLSGTFKAWLSDANGSPSTRFSKGAGEYRRLDGMIVAKSFSDLTDGSLLHPINVTETGAAASSTGNTYVYTGTKPDGTLVTIDSSDPDAAKGATCAGWTMQSDSAQVAYGNYSSSDQSWSYGGMRQGCSTPLRMYCFEQ